jgi:hypothetical protein
LNDDKFSRFPLEEAVVFNLFYRSMTFEIKVAAHGSRLITAKFKVMCVLMAVCCNGLLEFNVKVVN